MELKSSRTPERRFSKCLENSIRQNPTAKKLCPNRELDSTQASSRPDRLAKSINQQAELVFSQATAYACAPGVIASWSCVVKELSWSVIPYSRHRASQVPVESGVYIVMDAVRAWGLPLTLNPVYIGKSKNLRRRLC